MHFIQYNISRIPVQYAKDIEMWWWDSPYLFFFHTWSLKSGVSFTHSQFQHGHFRNSRATCGNCARWQAWGVGSRLYSSLLSWAKWPILIVPLPFQLKQTSWRVMLSLSLKSVGRDQRWVKRIQEDNTRREDGKEKGREVVEIMGETLSAFTASGPHAPCSGLTQPFAFVCYECFLVLTLTKCISLTQPCFWFSP